MIGILDLPFPRLFGIPLGPNLNGLLLKIKINVAPYEIENLTPSHAGCQRKNNTEIPTNARDKMPAFSMIN